MKILLIFFLFAEINSENSWIWEDESGDSSSSATTTSKSISTTPVVSLKKCLKRCLNTNGHKPVCGTDGKTYNSIEHLMCTKTCGIDVEKLFNGDCNQVSSSTTISTPNTSPTDAFQKCFKRCPKTNENQPVCGSNDVTYHNIGYLLCAKKCGINLKKLRDGFCSQSGTTPFSTTSTTLDPTSTNRASTSFTTLSTIFTTPSNSFKKCLKRCLATNEYKPVCGTNNVTYKNVGHMMCAKKCGADVEKLSDGTCREITTTATTSSTSLTTTSNNIVFRKCLKRCPSTAEYNPVCGSDRMTYTNFGRLLCAKRCGINVEKVQNGVCAQSSSNFNAECFKLCPKTTNSNPICGSNGVYYQNENELKCAQKCGADVQKLDFGNCESSSVRPISTSLPPTFRSCIRSCIVKPQYQPICSSDGNTYNNESELKCDVSCGKNVKKLRDGVC